ncbi:putative kinase [Variovorax boronicumulans]|uniref:AAA family ATPase n=1 Tax=Variovorax boronicumulans TaxID=436515 RepID=UPI0027868E8B|nr:AAA family ATPase [Variovorax boronicumulans]MDQ0080631.1 putative kinase [Variovorax boronicumulans]
MLIVLGGLPGSGKTTIAREIAALVPCVYLRIDTIEQALRSTDALAGEVGPAGYVVAYELARSNLSLGLTVVADCVNPLPVTREAWRAVAADASSRIVEVEIVCSDIPEHRRRVEQRSIDVPGLVPLTWAAVQQRDYEPWTTQRLVIDTASVSAREAAQSILSYLRD